MASGEKPISIATTNMQFSAYNVLASALNHAVLTTPATPEQEAYGSIQPKLSLGLNALNCCVHYLCLRGWVCVFYVEHIDKIMKPFSVL
jgi:hypothetical protein